MKFAWLISLKPFLLLVVAIPTGLFVRTVGELFVSWAKKPTEDAKKAKEKRAKLLALRASIRNASQYCVQMAGYLEAAMGVHQKEYNRGSARTASGSV